MKVTEVTHGKVSHWVRGEDGGGDGEDCGGGEDGEEGEDHTEEINTGVRSRQPKKCEARLTECAE